MDVKKEALVLAAMSAVVILLSLAGLAWVFLSGMGFTLDAIFMVLVCLLIAGVFSLMLLYQLKSAGLLPALKFSRAGKKQEASAESVKEAKTSSVSAKEEAP